MDRQLRLPDRQLVDSLNRNFRSMMAIHAQDFGAGAVREVWNLGPTSVSEGTPSTLATMDLDPGLWVVFFSTVATTTLSAGGTADMELNVSLLGPLDGATHREARPFGPRSAQLSSVSLLNLSAATGVSHIDLVFAWTGSGPSVSCAYSTIAVAPL